MEPVLYTLPLLIKQAPDRLVLIIFPSVYHRMYQRHWIAAQIAAIWTISLVLLLPTLVGAWGEPRSLDSASMYVHTEGRNLQRLFFSSMIHIDLN